MKKLIIAFTLTLIAVGCNKNNGNSGGGTTPTNPNKDVDNFITIDGVTNYHYSDPNTPKGFFVMCSNNIYQWSNGFSNQPDNGAMIQITKTKIDSTTYSATLLLSHVKNGLSKTYCYRNISSKTPVFPEKVVNGYTVMDFNNLKVYEGTNLLDTSGPYKYFTGRFTCNGK